MLIVSRASTHIDLVAILADLTNDLPRENWDACIIFISLFSNESAIEITREFRKHISCANFIGCSTSGVITAAEEVENKPAVSLILMKFDDVKIKPFHITQSAITSMEQPSDWYTFFDVYPTEKPKFVIFPDPFSIDIGQLLTGFNKAYDLCPVVGGLASGGMQAGENILILNETIYDDGCVGLLLQGDLRIETVVSQGCRPIGKSYIITKCENNVIFELGGKHFYTVLEEVLNTQANDRDRKLAQEAIFLGIAMDEYKHELKTGDFLIRMVIGLDPQSGAGAIADQVRTGQTVQFHVRDAISATHELTDLMDTQIKRHPVDRPQGALIFSCTGRGKNLFGISNHDLDILKGHVGNLPISGFFCAGEIGPVGGRNFAHGFTSSIALFYPNAASKPPGAIPAPDHKS